LPQLYNPIAFFVPYQLPRVFEHVEGAEAEVRYKDRGVRGGVEGEELM
jgi:hypothetical protein